MHSCLRIPYLVLTIIHFLADDRPVWPGSHYLRNRRDLARFAQTCKTLADFALDVLWHTQHSLAPLIVCLPADLWEIRAQEYSLPWELSKRDKTIYFKRDLTPQDWSSARKYARRIRSISQPVSCSLPRLDDTALATLVAPSNFDIMLPSLQFIDCSVISVTAPIIRLLTNVLSTRRHLESLTGLIVSYPKASQPCEVYNFMQTVRTTATRLRILQVSTFNTAPPNPSLVVELLPGELRFLQKLELGWRVNISAKCLSCLLEMDYLQELTLCVRHDITPDSLMNGYTSTESVTPSPRRAINNRTFPVLKSLEVMAYSLDQCTALMSLINSPFLDTITFSYDVQATSTLIESFFRQVQETCCNPITLSMPPVSSRTISLTLKHNLNQHAPSPFLIHPPKTFSPLLSLPNLRVLRLLQLGMVVIDDGFLREAADVWGAHLEEFEECGPPWIGMEEAKDIPGFTVATFVGIGVFVRGCPRLRKLEITFDGRDVPRLEDHLDEHQGIQAGHEKEERGGCGIDSTQENRWRWGPPPASPALQTFLVRDSPISDPEGVAKFLKRVAPMLREIIPGRSSDVWSKWEEVEDRMNLSGTPEGTR